MAQMNSHLGSRNMLKLLFMASYLLVVFAKQRSLLQSKQYDDRDGTSAANRNINNNNRLTQNEEHDVNTIQIEERRLYNPSDHYFCGVGFADASESCTHPCPGGSTSE